MLKFEFEPAIKDRCDCCNGEVVRLTRFISLDGNAYAVYYAQFYENHPGKRVHLVVSIGSWHEGSTPKDRNAFPMQMWADSNSYQVGFVEPKLSPWSHTKILGKLLKRRQALKHKQKDEVFHITNHIAVEDKEIIEYLNS